MHLPGRHIQPIHLRLNAALDGFQLLRVIAAVYDDILAAAGGEDFPLAVLVPDAGQETLSQPFPVGVLERVHISADIMLFQDLRDLTGSDLRLGRQLLQNLRLRVRRDSDPAGCHFLRFLHRHTSNPRAGSSAR